MVTNYTKNKKDSEVFKMMDSLFSKIEPTMSMKKEHCQYLNRSGGRYCNMTTLKSCAKYRHFTPTTQSKMRILVERVLAIENENFSLRLDLERCQHTIRSHEITIKALEEKIKLLEKTNDKRRVCKDHDDNQVGISEGDESLSE